MARSPLRRWFLAGLGGVVPIPSRRDPRAVPAHLAAADAVLASGGVFCLFPETGPATPPGTIRRLGAGIGYIAIRNRAPIVPLILGGTHELFLGRRIVMRVLAPFDPLVLAGLDVDGSVPEPGSPEERVAVHRLLDALAAAMAGAVLDAHERAEPPPGTRKRGLRRLTAAFR
jgi:1-acyl-sn-glycerol-3-phosphate acyltransferase